MNNSNFSNYMQNIEEDSIKFFKNRENALNIQKELLGLNYVANYFFYLYNTDSSNRIPHIEETIKKNNLYPERDEKIDIIHDLKIIQERRKKLQKELRELETRLVCEIQIKF